jgi:hypothetical protein
MLTEDERDRVRMGHQMEEMLKTDAWVSFAHWVQERGNQIYGTIMVPLKSMDSVLEQEYQKGTLRGIELTMEGPARIVAEMNQLLAAEDEEDTTDGR